MFKVWSLRGLGLEFTGSVFRVEWLGGWSLKV